MSADSYKLVQLRNGSYSLHSSAYAETMHPGLGPAAEAEALYVRQLDLPALLQTHHGEFVIWDVGLGAAANALAVLRASRDIPTNLCLHSFDHSLEPLRFALANRQSLGFLDGYEAPLETLANESHVEFQDGARRVQWHLHVTDFPQLLRQPAIADLPRPHVVLFDAFSPARNPEMWTLPLFTALFHRLAPSCILVTYSRSTMIRAALLLAGFFVGRGEATGLKEETTVAANNLQLLKHPLDHSWLERAKKSGSAEPLTGAAYHQRPLSEKTWHQLQAHPQFHNLSAT